MEDNQTTPTPEESAAPGQVINVQVREEAPGIIPIVEAAGDSPVDSPVAEAPEQPTPPTENPEHAPAPSPAPTPAPHKPAAPVAAIVAAIVVAVGLAAVTFYAYQKSQKNSGSDKYSLPTSQTQTETTIEPAKEVEAASTDVDNALKSADETDFPETELTDEDLNL